MDDRVLAMLGDSEAAERLTEAGIALPCPCCGKHEQAVLNGRMVYHAQSDCVISSRIVPLEKWNTRAPILTPAQLALLRVAEEPRKFEEVENGG